MESDRTDDKKTEEKRKQLDEKDKKMEGTEAERPEKNASGGVAGQMLKSIGNMIPGLGGLIESVSKLPAFQDRLGNIGEELERRLREASAKGVKPEVSGGVSGRPIGVPPGARARGPSTTSTPGVKVKRKRPDQRLAAQAPEEIPVDVFEEGDSIVVIAELPGVAEEDVEVNAEGRTLSIVLNTEGAKRSREVELPCDIQGEPRRSLNKGILKIQIEKARTSD